MHVCMYVCVISHLRMVFFKDYMKLIVMRLPRKSEFYVWGFGGL